MPGFHSKKTKRQAKHIIAGYEKRGVSDKTAKSIAWATVNSRRAKSANEEFGLDPEWVKKVQASGEKFRAETEMRRAEEKRLRAEKKAKKVPKTESWMFNGAGQPVFIGSPAVSQFDPSGQVSPGASYLPDEVAKMLVKESGLRKSDTINKRVIAGYLESMGLSAGLAVDVAKVLRDVYGITPTFDEVARLPESTLYARSGALIEELSNAITEGLSVRLATDDDSYGSIIGSFIQNEFAESTDADYDIALAHLAMLSPDEFCDVVDFHEWVGADAFNYIESLVVDGNEGVAEKIVEGLCWPHRVQFMDESIQVLFEDVKPLSQAQAKKFPSAGKMLAAPEISPRKQAKVLAKDNPSINKSDPLADKKSAHDAANAGYEKKPIPAVHTDPNLNSKLIAMKNKKGPGLMKKAGSSAIKLIKKVSHAVKSGAHSIGKAVSSLGHKKDKENAGGFENARMHKLKFPMRDAKKDSAKDSVSSSEKHTAAGSKAKDVPLAVHNPSSSSDSKKPREFGKKIGGLAVKGLAGIAQAGTHIASAAVRGAIIGASGGKFGNKKEEPARAAKKQNHDASSEKPGFVAGAIGKFARGVKTAYHSANTPGIDAEKDKDSTADKETKQSKSKDRSDKNAVNASLYINGPFMSEMTAAFNGYPLLEDAIEDDLVRSPAEVIESFDATTVVDIAILDAIGEMEWTAIAGIAGFVMLESENFISLIQSFQEGTSAFRSEWFRLQESGVKPEWMNIGSFVTLANLSLDEAVVPRLVYWAARAIQEADEAVVEYVSEAYPELGKTVYGPAGDPKEGPEIAKLYMSPQPSGTMIPVDTGCTTRMFSDPVEREKEREEKLSVVMAALDAMRNAAAQAGVPPEGMFLNVYREMHREKVRYS